MLERVPALLKQHPQWLLWQAGTKIPLQCNSRQASVIDPRTWCSFDNAMETLSKFQANPANKLGGAGFVLGGASGTAGTDLDKCLNPDGSVIDYNAVEIAKRFETYTEVSPSGTGLHCIYLAQVRGRRADRYEMYGSGRYFTMTGNVYIDLPIVDRQVAADEFAKFLDAKHRKTSNTNVDWSVQPKLTHHQVWERCIANTDFLPLWEGTTLHAYPSHSEAALALANMLAFWTESPNQVGEMFSASPLCAMQKDDKYRKRRDQLLHLVELSFDRKVPTADLTRVYTVQPTAPKPVKRTESDVAEDSDPFVMPPGNGAFNAIATFIYQQSKYPMKQAAIAATLAFMAGICGRQYQYSKSGLNLFVLLAAETGSGKEAMSTGIGRLMDAITNPSLDVNAVPSLDDMPVPAAKAFRGPGELTGAGLLTSLKNADPLSMFSVFTEIADTMEEMSSKYGNAGIKSLKKQLLILYMAASENSTYKGKVTSDPKTSIGEMISPAFTMLGECTPDRLYETLTPQLITDGLLPRFVLFENKKFKDRWHNKHHTEVEVDPHLAKWLRRLCANVLDMKSPKQGDRRIKVEHTADAAARSEEYREYASQRLEDDGANDATRELWNRTHLNAIRVAALVAIGCDMYTPCITVEMLDWAWKIILRQTVLLVGKFTRGETGDQSLNSAAQVETVMQACRHFLTMSPESFAGQQNERILVDGRNAGYIPYSYIQMRTGGNRAAFKGLPHAKALKDAIEVAISSGLLRRQKHPEHYEAKYYEII